MTEEFQFPMLATPSAKGSNRQAIDVRRLVATGGWALDLKLDGIRAYCHFDGTEMRLVNRMGVDITSRYPEIASQVLPAPVWLDGEIVADDGSFETVLTRDKQESPSAIKRGAKLHPCRFVAFDLPGFHQSSWTVRREHLEMYLAWVRDFGDGNRFDMTACSDKVEFMDEVAAKGGEGVIAKRKNARYQFGKRSADWVKHKNLHRITCLAAGYTEGEGSRKHFGALLLALVNEDGQLVFTDSRGDEWRVGSGFTVKDTHMLKARLDAGEVLVVEVEVLNVTSGGALRFPVYRGIRTDVDVLACNTAQLASLPAC